MIQFFCKCTSRKGKWEGILDAGYWILDAGYWILDTGYWILDAGYWMLDTGYWKVVLGSGLKNRIFWLVIQAGLNKIGG